MNIIPSNQDQNNFGIPSLYLSQNKGNPIDLLESTYDKIGNEIEFEPIGYKNLHQQKEISGKKSPMYEFTFKIKNSGMSD